MLEFEDAVRRNKDLGELLREFRKAAGLSGDRLAARANMSQAKISRIETGRIMPTVADTERILRALGVPPLRAAELLTLARAANIDFISRNRMRQIGAQHRQRELTALIKQAERVRYFAPVLIPSFLQTADYVRTNIASPVNKISRPQREPIVAAKLARGELLRTGSVRIDVLFLESALRYRLAPATVMADQVAHLAEMSLLPRVNLRIVPSTAEIDVPPLNAFVVYDRRLVSMESFAGSVAFRDPSHVEEHLECFNHFDRNSIRDDNARELLRRIAVEF